jgi:hypothetical protein
VAGIWLSALGLRGLSWKCRLAPRRPKTAEFESPDRACRDDEIPFLEQGLSLGPGGATRRVTSVSNPTGPSEPLSSKSTAARKVHGGECVI